MYLIVIVKPDRISVGKARNTLLLYKYNHTSYMAKRGTTLKIKEKSKDSHKTKKRLAIKKVMLAAKKRPGKKKER